MTYPVRDRLALIHRMAPERRPGRYAFRTVAVVPADAVAMIREDEGLSAIVPHTGETGDEMPMAWITLGVVSALDGVGLTAAVSGALADAGIACNVVAGHHHDHLFVPEAEADRALELLRALSGA